MKIAKKLSLALLLGGMCLSSQVRAQERNDYPKPDLELTSTEHSLTVTGGQPSAPCVLLIGIESGYTVLPGAVLHVNALLVLFVGSFDENGEYTVSFEPPPEGEEPLTVLVQAVTVNASMTEFSASNLLELEFGSHASAARVAPEPPAAVWSEHRVQETR